MTFEDQHHFRELSKVEVKMHVWIIRTCIASAAGGALTWLY
jgi:hypothetical protein